jgi:hypothetical protein
MTSWSVLSSVSQMTANFPKHRSRSLRHPLHVQNLLQHFNSVCFPHSMELYVEYIYHTSAPPPTSHPFPTSYFSSPLCFSLLYSPPTSPGCPSLPLFPQFLSSPSPIYGKHVCLLWTEEHAYLCRDGGGGEPGRPHLLLPAGGRPEHRQRQVVPQHYGDLQDCARAPPA